MYKSLILSTSCSYIERGVLHVDTNPCCRIVKKSIFVYNNNAVNDY